MNKLQSVLSVRQLSKTFRHGERRVAALAEVDLEVPRGSLIAVMGASGSGKSTLLHLIAGLTKPDCGEVFIDGRDLWQMPERELTRFRREKVGFVFQSFNLVSALSAEDNIMLPKISAGQKCSQTQLTALMDDLGISNRRSHRPDALSGGEQQRVAIARALYSEAEIILADEPTGSLDSQNAESICHLLRKICDEQNKTVIVVTHEPSVAKWADSIVVLKDGQIINQFEASKFESSSNIAAHCAMLIG